MTSEVLAARPGMKWPRLGYLPAIGLLLVAATAGPAFGALARPLFILGCAAVGFYAWRRSPAEHLQTALMLFAFAPFVRRLIDLSAGYDQSGLMLIGPLLTLLAPVPALWSFLESGQPMRPAMGPIIAVAASVAYGAALSLFQGDWVNAASGSLKWFAPLIYAAVVVEQREAHTSMIEAAASAFLVILPLIGLYGIFQYIDPPAWDRYWMNYASITSAGQPLPYEVRTFSTMNSPASFATFTAIGLLLICFLRSSWLVLFLAGPAVISLSLSIYRTAWISLAAGMLFCLFFSSTRRRASAALVGLIAMAGVVATATPFAEVISDRLATLGEGTGDGSAQERLQEFVTLWNQPDSGLTGAGFTIIDAGNIGSMPVDGMIIACWLTMGIVVGLICLAGFIWAAALPIAAAWQSGGRHAVLIGALACGALTQLPLANISSGEMGFLFWTFAAMAGARPKGPATVGKAI